MKHASTPLLRYGVAILAVCVALLIKVSLDPMINEQSPFLLLAAAVMVGAWFGGLGPGLAATALGAVAADYLFIVPHDSFTGPGSHTLPLVLFAMQGALISVLTQALRTARSRSAESALELLSNQESLRESESLYRAVVENAAENIFLVDIETRRVLEANAALHRSLGYAPEELKAMTLYDVVAEREGVNRNIERIRRGGTFAGERRYRRKDGTLMDVEVNASAISYRGKEAMCVVAHDVTERKRSEAALRRSLDALLALYEAGQILSSSLMREEIASRLLEITRRVFDPTAAVVSLRAEGPEEGLRAWRTVGPEEKLGSMRDAPGAEAARCSALESEEHRTFVPEDEESFTALFLPLRVRDRTIGLLEVYGRRNLAEREVVETCASLANQAASALENARLYEELIQRERQLHDLVGKLLSAQEEERRRVAYDIHDGLAQTAAAAHQYLQGFARQHPPASESACEQLREALDLVRTTVGEARQVISDLRPTALDDFGLVPAIYQQVSSLRAEGREVAFVEELDEKRLPVQMETTLFRVAQEALTNVRKHAGPDAAVRVRLERGAGGTVRLEVRDEGRGFRPDDQTDASAPGERVGLSGMRERVALLGGSFDIRSAPGAGTTLVAEVPLPKEEGGDA